MKTSAPAQTTARKAAAVNAKAPVKAKPAPASKASQQTALAKRMPDYIHPPQKRRHIRAKVDIGFGNAVYLRGDGGGLSWDAGVPLLCLADDLWEWSYPEDNAPREIKFLRNDTDWALGENHVVLYQEILVCTPQFS